MERLRSDKIRASHLESVGCLKEDDKRLIESEATVTGILSILNLLGMKARDRGGRSFSSTGSAANWKKNTIRNAFGSVEEGAHAQ